MEIYENKKNLAENSRNFSVKNWEHPEFWETLMPHDTIPRVEFSAKPVPEKLSGDTLIHDLSLTEGGLCSRLDEEELLAYFDLLRRISGSRGVVRCLEVPSDRVNLLARFAEKNYQFPEIMARVSVEDKVAKIPSSQLVCDFSGSDFYLQALSHSSRQDEFKAMQHFVTKVFEAGKVPVVRLLDVSRAHIDSYLCGIVQKLLKMAEDADLPVRLRLVDGFGLWLPYARASLPRGLPRLLHLLLEDLGYPREWLILETSNDFAMAGALCQTAWLYGADAVAVTIGGRGPRSGLISMEQALASILALRADAPRINLPLLRDLENLVTASGQVPLLPENAPYLGKSVFLPRSSRESSSETLANVYDPSLVWGLRQDRLPSNKSKRHEVAAWLKKQLGQGVMLSADHPGVVKMTEWLSAQDSSHLDKMDLLRQAKRYLPGFFIMEGREIS
jgi:isopropylmalate/homocitrate/citramalate synthase